MLIVNIVVWINRHIFGWSAFGHAWCAVEWALYISGCVHFGLVLGFNSGSVSTWVYVWTITEASMYYN